MNAQFNTWFLSISISLAVVIFLVLLFVNAPYGRHRRQGWGISLPARWGWLIMESPAMLVFGLLFASGDSPKSLPLLVFFALWEAHYIHRSLIYPFMISDGRKSMPIAIISFGILFNGVNAYFNGAHLFNASSGYAQSWMRAPQMTFGVILFIVGFIINRWADRVLQQLRKPGESGYKIPHGGLYNWISCPNYLGEILEWLGWAIATWSLPGLAFALWTIANLAPRARAHHKWYHQHFPNYPSDRKALIPKVW
jgi:3-oxo-5-alpha-steroid 4-dehydrogenase 1